MTVYGKKTLFPAIISGVLFFIAMATPIALILCVISLVIAALGWYFAHSAEKPDLLVRVCRIVNTCVAITDIIYIIVFILTNTLLPVVVGNIV